MIILSGNRKAEIRKVAGGYEVTASYLNHLSESLYDAKELFETQSEAIAVALNHTGAQEVAKKIGFVDRHITGL